MPSPTVAIALGLLAGCGKKDDPITKAEKENKDERGVLKYDISQGVPLAR